MANRGRTGDLDEACRDLRNGAYLQSLYNPMDVLYFLVLDKGCPYLPPPGTDSRMGDARDAILVHSGVTEILLQGLTIFSRLGYAERH